MQNTNIVSLLKTFSKKEFNEFEAFINSPIQIRKRDVTSYFKAIKKFYPDFKSPLFTDEKIYEKIFSGKKYDKAKYTLAAFHLFDAACDFLVVLNSRENSIERSFSLMNQFLDRGMKISFEKLARKLDKELIPENFSLEHYFYLRFKYEDLLMKYHSENHNYDSIKKYYNKKTDSSTGLFLLKSLRAMMNNYIIEKSYNSEEKIFLFEKIVNATDFDSIFSLTDNESFLKILKTDYYIYKAIYDDGKEDWAEKAEKSFLKNFDLYSREEKVIIFRELFNLYIKKSRETSDPEKLKLYDQKHFELTKKLVENDLTYSKKDKYMRLILFRNIILTALDVKEYKWAENFINEHSDKLKPSLKNSMKNFSLSELEFRKGNFEKSLEYLSLVKYDSFFFKRDVKLLMMNLYYELEFFEQAYFTLENTKKYLKTTSDVTEEEKRLDYNFLKYYKKLLKLTEVPDADEIQISINEINKIRNEIETSYWLIQKFEKLNAGVTK